MDFLFIFLFIIYISFCAMVASMGSGRHIGGLNAFIIAFLLSPLVGFVVTALSSRLPKESKVSIWKQAVDDADRLAFKHQYPEAIDRYQDAAYELSRMSLRGKRAKERDALVDKYNRRISDLQSRVNEKAG